jgi:hypothetical protein
MSINYEEIGVPPTSDKPPMVEILGGAWVAIWAVILWRLYRSIDRLWNKS